ncbi:MaoC family dehydratase N-terminal domain-containing protein [Sphingopyxis indica]|uniref:FAS1-like dehydratase domain-containing protein n=1 Tax=Sphingopyxis indica TaxID=436663 RepID=UPI002938D603|nr:MaoC family dehydratase N-terminal domain-containing protein [Sphingopyxis indica]WOF44606.1 MaoC family dehydratase N-terminal domain-containing protein [Sphingopyxis indica]
MSDWQQWVGREDRRSDRVEAGALTRWLATLDRAAGTDGAVPQGFHWCLALPDAPTAALGADGHPRRTDGVESFMPPVPLPRRMWASSQVEFLHPLHPGEAIARRSRIAAITAKQGGSGALVFVEIAHETHGDRGLAVRESQSIVFRDAAGPDAPLSPPPAGGGRFDPSEWDAHRTVEPSEALLFRYSALTFNSHRIHYDFPYAIAEERYRGLVVHGPLTATLLLDLAQRRFGDNALARFAFRGLSPAIASEPLHLVLRGGGDAIELGAFADDGRQVMQATATL